MKCVYCGSRMTRGPWGRDDRGKLCRDCWNLRYPPDNPNKIVIPELLVDGFIVWRIPECQPFYILSGEYTVRHIDYEHNTIGFWVPCNSVVECKELDGNKKFWYDYDHCYNIGVDMQAKTWEATQDGYMPFLTYLSEAQRYTIIYRKRRKTW